MLQRQDRTFQNCLSSTFLLSSCSIRAYEVSRKSHQRRVLLLTSCSAFAQSELDVRIKPSNDALKANIEGYIGGVGDRDEEALRAAVQPWRRRAGAQGGPGAGFYQPKIESDVTGGKNPRLTLTIDPGEPVHLRSVTLRVDGRPPTSRPFAYPPATSSNPARCSTAGITKTPSV